MRKITESLNTKIEKMKFEFMQSEKIVFLKTVNKNSQPKTTQLYMSVMNKIGIAESINGREWFRFTEEMVDSAIVDFKSKSIITLQSYMSVIRDYLTTTTPKLDIELTGYLYTITLTKNDLLDLDEAGNEKPDDMKKYYINKMGEQMQYVTEEEFDKILECTADASAKVLAILLFNGIRGDGYVEVASIRREDVDIEARTVKDRHDNIVYHIPEKYVHIFEEAANDEKYLEYDYEGNVVSVKLFVTHSSYFLRRTAYRLYDGLDPIDMNIVNRRIKALGKAAMNPHITPTSIVNSGLTLRLLEECGYSEPNTVQLEEFRNKYNVKLSYTSMKTISKILLDKLTSPSE